MPNDKGTSHIAKKGAYDLKFDASRSGQYRPPDLEKRVERRRVEDEAFRISEERRIAREAKEPKPKPPPPPKTGMQRFKESMTRIIGLGGILDALDSDKKKKGKK